MELLLGLQTMYRIFLYVIFTLSYFFLYVVCFIDLGRCSFFFFFQAEDGIRDLTVTGVQTCALPICGTAARAPFRWWRRTRRASSGPRSAGRPGTWRSPRRSPGARRRRTTGSGRTRSRDRKSTRLNSSHSPISYAVFCLRQQLRFPGA